MYKRQAAYTNKTSPTGLTTPVTINRPGSSPATPALASEATFHTDQTSMSLALEKSGYTFSAGYADHKWKNVTIDYYRLLQANSVYKNSTHSGSTTLNNTTRLLNPKLFDFSVGYQKPMLGGYGAVKLGHTVASNWGTGLSSAVIDAQLLSSHVNRQSTETIQRNRTHITSVGFAHHVKNLSTGLFLNHYRNHALFQSKDKVAKDLFNAVELGTNYAW